MVGVGIEINGRQTTAVEVTGAGAGYRVGRSAVLAGYTHDAASPVTAAASGTFAASLEQAPPAMRKRAGVSLPSKDIIFRMTEVGSSNRGAISALVRLEVDELTGGGTPMLPAFQIVNPPESAPLALIGVAREEVVEHYSDSIAAAGLNAGFFAPGPVALYHCYSVCGPVDHSGVQMVVNVGEHSTDIAVVTGGDLLVCRSLALGVESMVAALARALGVNAEQARETLFRRIDMRPGVAGPNVSGERAVAAAQDAAAQLFMQLSGTIAYARGQLSMPKMDISQILLSGTGSSIRGLAEFLQSRFRKPVLRLNPLSGFDVSGLDDATATAMSQHAPSLAIPLGLAVMAARRNEADLKFVPSSVVARTRFLTRTIWLYAGFLIVLAALVGSLYLASAAAAGAEDSKKAATGMAQVYQAGKRDGRRVGTPPALTDPLKNKLAHLSSVDVERVTAVQKLSEILELRRPSLFATEICFHVLKTLHPQVTLTGMAMEPLQLGNGPDVIGLKIGMFIESGAKKPEDLYKEIENDLRAHRAVKSVAARKLELVGGRGQTGEFQIVLSDSAELLKEMEQTK